mmetsp:Transcript_36809/g.52026  ORF Transcript_36809/g.52026 Transcript_36809/m.52026 type:complete len:234 (-) Transcript_36809:121-822(-)
MSLLTNVPVLFLHFQKIPFCVHTIAYNVIPLIYMVPLGFSVGLSVRIGHLLGQGEIQKAKTLCISYFVFLVSLGIIMASIVWLQREFILALFTNDEDVLEGCLHIWPKVCIYLVLLFIYGFNSGLLRALGKQLEMATVVIVVLWIFGMPLLWYVGKTRGGGIDAIWTYCLVLYAIMDVGLIATSLATDWQAISDRIVRQKYTTSAARTTTSDMDDSPSMKKTSERTGLLPLKN